MNKFEGLVRKKEHVIQLQEKKAIKEREWCLNGEKKNNIVGSRYLQCDCLLRMSVDESVCERER
jgi:hypothetical protein